MDQNDEAMTKDIDARGAEASERLASIRDRIEKAQARFGSPPESVCLVAVSKAFGADDIVPLLDLGQRVFGENRVQEAKDKWPALKMAYPGVDLHLIGPLQTNKVKDAVALFDVIESVDREKVAAALAKEMKTTDRFLPCFIQINIGGETQKAGIAPSEAVTFVDRCRKAYGLNIVGLMCIPPVDQAPGPYFAQLAGLAKAAGVDQLSMGMSADYEVAINMGATHVRVGSALFGGRG